MSVFFISGREAQQAREDAYLQQPETNFWDQPFEGLSNDVAAGLARQGEGLNQLAVTAGRWLWNGGSVGNFAQGARPAVAALTPQDTDWERYFSANADDWARVRRSYAIDSATRSNSANLIGGLAGTLTTFIAGSVVGGPAGNVLGAAGAGFGYGRESQERLLEQGADPETALTGGVIEGGVMALMGLAPVAIPGRLWQRALTGAGINLGFGVAQRGSMNAYLTERGYGAGDENDLASQYQWMDGQAATIDAVLGASFGALFGSRANTIVRPHPPAEGETESAPVTLPQDGEGYFEEARQYGNDQQFSEAYAYALIARDFGHPEADGLISMIEEDASATDLDAGRDLAEQIAREHVADAMSESPASAAALIEADTLSRSTAFGIPENQASRRWQSDALSRMEEQAARDEPIDPGPVPEDVGFVPLPVDPDFQARVEGVVGDYLREQGLDARAIDARLDEIRDANPDMFDPDGSPRFSLGPRGRGVDAWRGDEAFHDARLSPQQNEAVRLALSNHSNGDIADALMVTNQHVGVLLSQAKQRIRGLDIPPSRAGAPPARGGKSASIEEIVALYNKLSRQGYRNGQGRPGLGRRTINTLIAERLGRGLTPGNVAKRLSTYRADLNAGRVEGEPLFARGDGESFSTVEDVIAAAEQYLGADWQALARAGHVEVVESRKDIPVVDGFGDYPPGVQAVHLPRSRTTYFVARNIRPEAMRGLILHEIGVHHGFESMLGKSGFKEVLRQLERMVKEDHPAVVEARAIATRDAALEAHIPEETLAYLIETHADLPLVQRVLSRIRQWLIKTFGSTFGMRLTVDDLRAMAITSLRRVAEQARRTKAPEGYAEVLVNPLYSSADGPDAGQWHTEQMWHGSHESAGPIEVFDMSRVGSGSGAGTHERAAFFTPERRLAEAFGPAHPYEVRGRLLDYDAHGQSYKHLNMSEILERARSEGYAGVRFRQPWETHQYVGDPKHDRLDGVRFSDQIAIFDPANIRPARNAPDGGASGGGQSGELGPLFHGTNSDIPDGQFRAPDWATGVHFTIGDAVERSSAGFTTGQSGRIYPAVARGEFFDPRNSAHIDRLIAEATDTGALPDRVRDPAVLRRQLAAGDWGLANTKSIAEAARRAGFDGMIYSEPGTDFGAVVVFPNADGLVPNVRSRFSRATDAPNAGNSGDFPQFSVRQNRDNLLGAKRDPIESPDYQRRLADVRTRAKEGGYDEAGPERSAGLGGVRGDTETGRSAGSDGQSRTRPSRALIRAVLDFSGVHLQTKAKDVGFGRYRATIDTPFASDADIALHGTEGLASYVDFDIRDGSNKKDAYPGLHIRLTNLNHGARNQKVSIWLYRQIIEWADRQGMAVYSDHVSISPEAQRTYSALRRRGYEIENIARNTDKDDEGYIINPDMLSQTPIFRIAKLMPIEEQLVGAHPPEGDYQIDGPTLRERQQIIDDQLKRQEEYHALSPAEQALRDNPEMKFSVGPVPRRRAPERMRVNLPAPFVGAADVVRNPSKAEVVEMLRAQRARDVQSVRWGIDQNGDLLVWDGTQAMHGMVRESMGGRFVRHGEIEDAMEIDAVLSTAERAKAGDLPGYDPAEVARELGISEATARELLARDGRLSGRAMLELAEAESKAAAEMRKGFEAAARCAARHGAGQGVRYGVAIPTSGVGEAFLGQALGAAMAIPFGITAAPFLGRYANPRRYAENRAIASGVALTELEARRSRNGAQAGRNAGLDAPTGYNDLQGEPLWDNVDTSARVGDFPEEPPLTEVPVQAHGGGNSARPLDYGPNTFSPQGGQILEQDIGPDLKVPPAPPGAKPRVGLPTDAENLARLFNMPEDEQ